MSPGLRRFAAACGALSFAVALVAAIHADVVAYLSVRAALHRAAVAGLRAVGPSGGPRTAARAPDVVAETAARAAWDTEAGTLGIRGTPRFTVRIQPVDGWPVLDIEASVSVALPWGVAAWLADGPVLHVRGGTHPG